MPQTRQLAAIMFTDIVGYTALMGNNEEKAFLILNQNRQLQKPIIEKYGGSWIKELGDGVMASFTTVSDAVYAATEIQQQCRQSCDFSLRIGIHHGEIVMENNDVFGDAVNVASRIQAIAPVGSIYVSESVYNNVNNKADIQTKFVKAVKLKNVKEPVRLYQVITEASGQSSSLKRSFKSEHKKHSYKYALIVLFIAALLASYFIYTSFSGSSVNDSPAKVTVETEKSIAVLPFVNMSNDKEQEYFSDGLSEELLNLLSKTPGLKVIGRTSSFYFKGKNEDLRVIGNKLGAEYVLEGSVRRSGNTLRISANLIQTDDGKQLWSESYDRVEEDVFKIQDEVASAVVKQLKLKLAPSTQGGSTSNIEAFNLVLQGNYFFDRLDSANVVKSIELYQKAIDLDPTYDKAWAMLARSYSRLAWFNFMDQNEGYEKARASSMKAIEINPNSVDGLRALGDVKQYHDFNWTGAEADFKRALEIEPGNAEVMSIYSVWHQIQGDFTNALMLSNEVLSRDPLRPLYYFIHGSILSYIGKHLEGVELNKKVLEINPAAQRAYGSIGRNYLLSGNLNEALAAINKEPWVHFRELNMNLYFHAAGKKKEADEALKNFVEKNHNDWAYYIATIYAFRNEKDKAIEWLEKAFQRKDTYMVYIKGDPLLKNLQNDPRYISILKRMNLN
jgi:adenylate cyclase